MQNKPDLTLAEAEWLRRYAARMIAEFSVVKSDAEAPTPSEHIAA
jgi:hypothetical protein